MTSQNLQKRALKRIFKFEAFQSMFQTTASYNTEKGSQLTINGNIRLKTINSPEPFKKDGGYLYDALRAKLSLDTARRPSVAFKSCKMDHYYLVFSART